MAGKNLIYSSVRPSGVDFGDIAERGMERLLREKKADEASRAAAAKAIRDARNTRDKWAEDSYSEDVFVENAKYLQNQILEYNEEVKTGMLNNITKASETMSAKDRLAVKSYNTDSKIHAGRIGEVLKTIDGINTKFTTVDKDGKPEYSPDLNAGAQLTLSQLMSGTGEYKLDFKTLKITDSKGEVQDANTFLRKNFDNLKKYVDPDEMVNEFLKGVDRKPFNSREIQWQDEAGKTHTRTVSDVNYDEVKKVLYSDFAKTFNADNLAWQQYVSETDDPEAEVTENMFRRGLARNGFMFSTTKDVIETEGGTVTERKAKKQKEDTTNWLIDFASGGTQAGGEAVLRDVSRTTQEGGMEKVYQVERFINPLTGEVGASIKTTTGKGEPQPAIIVSNLATPQGAAEVLDMAVSKPRSTFAKYDELDVDAQTLATQAKEAQSKLSPERREELIQKGLVVGVERSLDKAFADVGRAALQKGNIEGVVESLYTELRTYLPADVLERVKTRVGVAKTGIAKGKRRLFIDDEKFETLNADTKGAITKSIGDVIKEEFAKTSTPSTAGAVDLSDIFNKK